jgi:hypothetical protein
LFLLARIEIAHNAVRVGDMQGNERADQAQAFKSQRDQMPRT